MSDTDETETIVMWPEDALDGLRVMRWECSSGSIADFFGFDESPVLNQDEDDEAE